ncbi:hypothetical protein KIN20_007432 [Parelaphostrongylus tenuis]|uniref:Uncharacterized protein n=1 Tax=Parelaphostrongylus tenuis TaxID=148309 RepID=A0AAD5QHW2_PARTN|nr:hypothetical protein KIN20_007432 [Parelaphostrongylus tenuis]
MCASQITSHRNHLPRESCRIRCFHRRNARSAKRIYELELIHQLHSDDDSLMHTPRSDVHFFFTSATRYSRSSLIYSITVASTMT